MPNLLGKNLAEANARLALVGLGPIVQFDIGGRRSCELDIVVEGQIVVIEKGQVCQQSPFANQALSKQTRNLAVILQQEDPWHGRHKGDPKDPRNQWHRMPNVIGMTGADAQAAIKKAGFTIEKMTTIVDSPDPICEVGRVCRQYPEPLHSARESEYRKLVVGAEPAAAPPPPPTTDKGGKATGSGEKKKSDFDF